MGADGPSLPSERPQVLDVPRSGAAAETAVPSTFLEYLTFARKSAEMLAEMTKIHAAVSESGDADAHQERWGELTAAHTALARQVVETAYPPADTAQELNGSAIPRLREELKHAQSVMENYDDLEGGLAQPYAQAQQIFTHLAKNLSPADSAAGAAEHPRESSDVPATSEADLGPQDFAPLLQGSNASSPSGNGNGNGIGEAMPEASRRPERDINSLAVDRSSSAGWRVSVDPPQQTLSLAEDARLGIKVPGTRSAGDAGVLYPLAPSPYVLLGTNAAVNQTSEVWHLPDRRRVDTIKGPALGSSQRIVLREDGKYLAAQPVHEGLVGIWDVDGGKVLGSLPVKKWAGVEFIGFGTGNRLAVVDDDDLVLAVLPALREERRVTLPSWRSATSYGMSPGGRFLAFHADDAVRVYDLTICQEVGNLPIDKAVQALAFSQDGVELAALYDRFDEAGIAIWDVATGRQKSEIVFEQGLDKLIEPNSAYRGRLLHWFPDGQLLLVSGCGIVDRQSGELLMTLPAKVSYPLAPIGPRQLGVVTGSNYEAYTITDEHISRARSAMAAGGKPMDASLPLLTASDRSGLQTLAVRKEGNIAWSISPERLGGGVVETKAQSSISIPSGQVYRGTLSAPAAGRIALMYSGVAIRTRPSSGWGLAPTQTPVRVDLYDTRRSRKLTSYELPFTTTLESLSPGGALAVTRIVDGTDRLDVWNLDEKAHVCGLRPYSHLGDESRDRDIQAVTFVDDSHLLTMNNTSLTLHEIPSGRSIYEITLDGGSRPALSPSRRFLALLDGAGRACHIFDALTGQQVGSIDCGRAPSGCGFHPSGEKLAVMIGNQTGGEVLIVGMADGQVLEQFPVPRSGELVQWMGDGHLLVGGEMRYHSNAYLIDIARRMVVWNYAMPIGMHIWDSADGRHWYLSAADRNARTFAVNGLTLPEPDVAKFLEENAKTPDLVLEPGGGLDVLVNVQDPPGESDFANRVRQNIIARYREAGINVVEGHSLVMSITGSSGSTGRSMKFGSIAGGLGSETVDVAEQEVRWDVTISRNGETIWDNTLRYSNGGIVWLQEGSDVSSQAGNQMWKSAIAGLLEYSPPTYVFPPEARDGLGASTLAPRGSVVQARVPATNGK
jgi:WD40 repeat protein